MIRRIFPEYFGVTLVSGQVTSVARDDFEFIAILNESGGEFEMACATAVFRSGEWLVDQEEFHGRLKTGLEKYIIMLNYHRVVTWE